MTNLAEQVRTEFVSRFGSDPLLVRAPARINFIGEHVDYNEGLVLPAAIDRSIVWALAPNGSSNFIFESRANESGISFTNEEIRPGNDWYHYLMGVLHAFLEKGINVAGLNGVVEGDIPVGAGLSSSAALCCGFAFGINELFSLNLPREELALIAQYAEHKFAGVNCGLMDQYACLFGRAGEAIFLDCRTLAYEYSPIVSEDFEILLVNTKVKHSLASSAYNDRRNACAEAVDILKRKYPVVQSLRDVSLQQLQESKASIPVDVFRKCWFVIEEIRRVDQAREALRLGDIHYFGELMFASHEGLSKLYEVSCPELDFLVTLAKDRIDQGVIGARMMGGGFGGCTLNVVQKPKLKDFIEIATKNFISKFHHNPEFYSVKLSHGAEKLVI